MVAQPRLAKENVLGASNGLGRESEIGRKREKDRHFQQEILLNFDPMVKQCLSGTLQIKMIVKNYN